MAEAKAVMLEGQLVRAEERVRVATYVRASAPGASASAEAAGIVAAAVDSGGVAETPREEELLAAALRAGEDAQAQREACEAANAHAAHYRAIAEANDATIKEMQTAFDALKRDSDAFRAEAEARRAAAEAEEKKTASALEAKWRARCETAEAKAEALTQAEAKAEAQGAAREQAEAKAE